MTATDTSEVTPMNTAFLRELGQQLRVDSIRAARPRALGTQPRRCQQPT